MLFTAFKSNLIIAMKTILELSFVIMFMYPTQMTPKSSKTHRSMSNPSQSTLRMVSFSRLWAPTFPSAGKLRAYALHPFTYRRYMPCRQHRDILYFVIYNLFLCCKIWFKLTFTSNKAVSTADPSKQADILCGPKHVYSPCEIPMPLYIAGCQLALCSTQMFLICN